MTFFLRSFFSIALFVAVFGADLSAQTAPPTFPTPSVDERRQDEPPRSVRDMLARRKAEEAKRAHEEMLERGETALELVDKLEKSFETSNSFTSADKETLNELEKVVTRIRRDLGGGSDSGKSSVEDEDGERSEPGTVKEVFEFLKSTTVKLVDELQKTTRFSISAVAIQTSNQVIRLARLLRLRP